MLDLEKYKRNLISALKLNGITIRSEFSSFIIETLHNSKINLNNEFENCVKIVCEYLEKHTDVGRSIEKSHIEKAVEACIQSGIDDHETTFNVINAFDFPKLYFDLSRKLYFLDSKNKSVLFSNPETKSELFASRYRNVLQRTQRSLMQKNELLETGKITLHTVDYLLTVSQRTLENNLILGSLFHGANGKYFIEDPTGMIELDLKHAKYHGGFFYENCFVLVNGYYSDKVLQVSTMILPPGEEFENSRAAFGSLNYFGGQSESLLRDSKKLSDVMHRNSGGMMVFISDLWLDKPIVFEKLQVLFEGLAEMPPIAFVFIGNFLSQCYAAETLDILSKSFKQLAELIKQFHNIKEYSHFVFVPGLNDPCMMHIVPRMALPKLLTDNFKKQIPKSTFTTNPCRIQYCTREIVIYRSDMLSKFMQESLNKPNKDKINDFITKTIVSQAHLSPFSLNVQPVHWSFDYTLHLYPLPNLVVIGDKCNPYAGSYKGCSIVNPGSIIESGFAFKTYIPASDTVDDCGL